MGGSGQPPNRGCHRRRVCRKYGCVPPQGKDSVTRTVSIDDVERAYSPAKSWRRHGSLRFARLPLLTVILFTTACGYHTAGHAVTLPVNVQTIAIPAFVNQTQTYKIEQKLTAAVVREMVTRTHYHILNEASDSADATLRGTVVSTSTSPLTYDSQTGRASSALVVLTARVTLTGRNGPV